MSAYSIEHIILEGRNELNNLFDFIKKNAEDMDAYSMEQAIFSHVMKIGLIAMRAYFAEKGTGDVGDVLQSSEGLTLKREKSPRCKNYFSVFGKVVVRRTCYRTSGCKGVMPLDEQANLPERSYSYLLQEWMNLLGMRDSFAESSITLKKLLGLDISPSRIEVITRESADSYDDFYAEKEPPNTESEGEIQVIGFDGKGVPVIKKEAAKLKARLGKGEKRQKKKEAIVGVSYSINAKVRSPEDIAKNLVYPGKDRGKRENNKNQEELCTIRAQNIRRVASLKRSKKEVMEEIASYAKRRNRDNQRPLVAVMDGALCLWSLLASVLSGVKWVGILDIIHVVEYLWQVGNALYGEDTKECKNWVYDHLLSILQGRVGRVIGGLKQTLSKRKLKKGQIKTLQSTIRYFENHRKWMHYDEYLVAGYPIGSGVVESTCGHTVKKRMEGTGRRWSIKGAESTLLLRSVYTSNDWEAYWPIHIKQERQRLYGHILLDMKNSETYSLEEAA